MTQTAKNFLNQLGNRPATPINGNSVLAKYKSEQNKLPNNSGRITNTSTGAVLEKINSKPKPMAKRRKKSVQDPMLQLEKMVNYHNDIIEFEELPDRTIPYVEYFDRNSPSFIENNESLGEEIKYVQNRLYKVLGDPKYVPDHEDMETMDDDTFMKFIDTGVVNKNSSGNNDEILDTDALTDDQFEEMMMHLDTNR